MRYASIGRMGAALAWEQARRTMPVSLVSLLVGVLGTVGAAASSDGLYTSTEISGVGLIAVLCVAASGQLYTFVSTGTLAAGIAPMTLRLPAPTWLIVVVRMTLSALILIGLALMLFTVQKAYFDLDLSVWTVVGGTLFVFSLLHVVAIAFGPMGDVSLVVLLLTLILSLYQLDETIKHRVPSGWSDETFVMTLGGMTWAGSMLIAYGLVLLQRRSVLRPYELALRLPGKDRAQTGERPPFASPAQAQRWFERRRARNLLPTVTATLGGGIIALAILPRHFQRINEYPNVDPAQFDTYTAYVAANALVICFLVAAVLAGTIHWFLNYRVQFGTQRSFYFLRPMETRELASARLAEVARVVAISGAVVIALTTIALLYQLRTPDEGNLAALLEAWTPVQLAFVACLLMAGVTTVAWGVYWMECVILVFLGAVLFQLLMKPWLSSYTLSLSGAMLLAALTIAGVAYVAYRRLVAPRLLGVAAALSPFSVGGVYIFWEWEHLPNLAKTELDVMLAVLSLAVLPLVIVPLSIQLARHR